MKISAKKTLLILLTFLLILTGFRLLWIQLFSAPEFPVAKQGELDLRTAEQLSNYTVSLDGEWLFYPNTGLIHNEDVTSEHNRTSTYINVPETQTLPNKEGVAQTYGYGTYHLRIKVDPDIGDRYALHIPSVRSASALYVNGELLAQSGQPAPEQQDYAAMDIPRTVSFTSEADVLDLVLVVANFDDPNKGGIIQSIEFGLEDLVRSHVQLTEEIVRISCIIYLLHAVYSLILYWTSNRDSRLLYFSLMILCIIVSTLYTERVLYAWLPMPLEWSVRIEFAVIASGGYFLLQCVRHQLTDAWRRKVIGTARSLWIVSLLLIALLPTSFILHLNMVFLTMMLAPCFLVVQLMYRATRTVNQDNLFLLLAAAAAIGSLVWLVVIYVRHIPFVTYPFDLVVALICFSIYWFKQFYRVLEESQKLSQKLQQADKQKDEFLLRVAHEMRNPLHGMINLSQSLAAHTTIRRDRQRATEVDLLVTVGRRMNYLLNDLLDFARLKDDRIVLTPTAIDIRSGTDAVMEMLRYLIASKPVRLYNHIPDSFPKVAADENRLTQILFNLLHNAVKFTNEGEVTVHAAIQDGQAHITVADTGTGIEESVIHRIFEPYEQGTINGSENGGFGLGLSICKQLITLHGGTLKVHSELGKGAAFTFTLPLATDGLDQMRSAPLIDDRTNRQLAAGYHTEQPHQTRPSMGRHRLRILAVDDDPVNLQVLQSIFSVDKYFLTVVHSGKEALSRLDSGEWDLVIADIMMPEMSGYELTSHIRAHYSMSELPVLLLTAYNRTEDIEAGFRAGANDYVAKPVQATELRSRAQSLANLKRSVTERLRMEGAWLQAQIKPHFLINTFTAIAMLGRVDLNRMDKLVQELSQYVRLSIDSHNIEGMTTVGQELQLVRAYLFIMQERFAGKLTIIWEVAQCEELPIPPLTIQPLVENALEHGISPSQSGGEVRIRVEELADRYVISVADNGKGMDTETVQAILQHASHSRKGIGLRNTDRRLKRLYQRGLRIQSALGAGTTIGFVIPKSAHIPNDSL